MTQLRAEADGGFVVESARYRLHVSADGLLATLTSPDSRFRAALRPLAALDCLDGRDETLAVEPPRAVDGSEPTVEVARRSTRWERAGVTLAATDEAIELVASVRGRGDLGEVHLLAGRSLLPKRPTGFLPSGSRFTTLFSPNPGDPGRVLRHAGETAVIGVAGDSEPGRGHWFFTPAPLCLALGGDDWLALGVVGPVEELTFGQLVYQPADRGFSLRLDYDGHTRVDGDFRAPALVLFPEVVDPYEGLRRYREHLTARGVVPAPRERGGPAWWHEPIFCGWGAQCYLAEERGGIAADHSTRENYDGFLAHLEREGVVPGTVVVDDKWQAEYGTCLPDAGKWPDLRGWIAGRHAQGQRVLLWWKAWDAQGLPAGLCIRNPDGAPIALDPDNPGARAAIEEAVVRMLGPDGLDADGLKVDFTGNAPSGAALTGIGARWGIALLHELLTTVYRAAKRAKPEALVITHTPHPSFMDVTDMLRLNDMLRLRDLAADPLERLPDVVREMRYRAEVVRAACPGVPIDTDDWCVPSRAAWREYVQVKPELGVPSLYYATHFDLTGEELETEDYAALRRTWDAWRARAGRGRRNGSPV